MRESKNQILRRIILNVSDKNTHVPDEIQTKDIKQEWTFINIVSPTPYKLKMVDNSNDESLVTNDQLNEYSKLLNRHWGTVNTGSNYLFNSIDQYTLLEQHRTHHHMITSLKKAAYAPL